MFPEAGGSSSFARHAFESITSFFAGWALSLDYILTIAISAFFVPHYLSAFPGLGGLKHNPDDIIGGLIVVGVLAGEFDLKTENVIAAKKAGVSNYIVKPFNAATLKTKMEAVFGPAD